jgi:type II secretory pathway pseudopilin PulG
VVSGARRKQAGFTYLWVLVAVAIGGVGLAAASEVWTTTSRRAKLEQADWAAAQYTQAIGSYCAFSPGSGGTYPDSIDALLEDRRGPTTRHHLRYAYRNPFATDGQWELVRGADARIRGLRVMLPAGLEPRERVYVYTPAAPWR